MQLANGGKQHRLPVGHGGSYVPQEKWEIPVVAEPHPLQRVEMRDCCLDRESASTSRPTRALPMPSTCGSRKVLIFGAKTFAFELSRFARVARPPVASTSGVGCAREVGLWEGGPFAREAECPRCFTPPLNQSEGGGWSWSAISLTFAAAGRAEASGRLFSIFVSYASQPGMESRRPHASRRGLESPSSV